MLWIGTRASHMLAWSCKVLCSLSTLVRLSFCNPGFMFPSHLVCKPKPVGLCHLLDCWIILFCEKISICKWSCIKLLYQDPVLSLLWLILKVNVLPSSEGLRTGCSYLLGVPLQPHTCFFFFSLMRHHVFPDISQNLWCVILHIQSAWINTFTSVLLVYMKQPLSVVCGSYL